MKILRSSLIVFLFSLAAIAQNGQQQFASLGDFKLENGETIRDCRIGYRTLGNSTVTSPTLCCFRRGSPEPARN